MWLDTRNKMLILKVVSPLGTRSKELFSFCLQGLANSVLSGDSAWGRLSFSSRRHTDISEESDAASDDANAASDVESDESNFDIIPFSEGEYEKIEVEDAACGTDDAVDTGRLSAGSSGSSSLGTAKSGKTSGCDTDGIDSALGRSISDDRVSVGTEAQQNSSVTHCSILLTADSAHRGGATKAVSFAPDADMRARPEGDTTMSSSRAASKKCAEAHDIGYSSESHSNDEPEDAAGGEAPTPLSATDPNSNGQPACTSSPILPPKQRLSLDNVVLRKQVLLPGQDTGSSSGNDNTPSPTCADKSWRHSMTSAYDTSSNCSDLNNPLDLDVTLETTVSCDTSVCTTIGEDPGLSSGAEAQEKVQALEASPSRKFYSVAGIESDASSVYSSKKCAKSVDGANPENSELNNSREVDFVDGDVASRFQHSTPVKDGESDAQEQNPPTSNTTSAKMLSLGDPWRQISRGKWPMFDRTESLSVQQDSDASSREAALNDDDFPDGSEDEKRRVPPSASNESIKRLIHQAELLVRDADLINIPANKSWVRRRKRASSKGSAGSTNANKNSLGLPPMIESSMPTTANPTDGDSDVSSCDASSEGSESGADYSTASSDPDVDYTSAAHSLGTSRSGVMSSSTSSGSTLLRVQRPSKASRAERPWSITELYELTNRIDLSPFSISESAIDDLSKQNAALQTSPEAPQRALRRATSDTASQRHKRLDQRRHRKRKLNRSASDDHDQTVTASDELLLPGVAPFSPRSCTEWRTASYSSAADRSGSDLNHSASLFYAERLPSASPLPEVARNGDSELDVAGEFSLVTSGVRSQSRCEGGETIFQTV